MLIAAWAAGIVLLLVLARADLSAAAQTVVDAADDLGPGDLVSGEAIGPLTQARERFADGRAKLDHPLLLPVRVLPIAGRQLRALRALAAAGEHVCTVGRRAALDANALVDDLKAGGPARVEALAGLGALARVARADLDAVDLGPDRALVGAIRERRDRLAAELARADAGLGDVATAANALSRMLAGPRRYLVVAANNAEMRAGSGMFLSLGVLTTADGELSLEEMAPTTAAEVPRGAVTAEPDVAARWGFAAPEREWRNLALTPRFDANAPMAAAMWEAAGKGPVDGVLVLDVLAIRAAVAATGPLTLDGGLTLDVDSVVDHLLHDQYLGTTDIDEAAQAPRREQLGEIANAAIAAIQDGRFDIGVLAGELKAAASGRHVLAWSSDPEEQAGWEASGVTGQVAHDSLLLAVMNTGGNKLDRFLRTSAEVTTGPADDGVRPVSIRVKVDNTTPEGEPIYVTGPAPGSDLVAGEYLGLVALSLPGDARRTTVEGGPLVVTGPDGPTRVVATEVRLPAGASTEVTFRFVVPADRTDVHLEPSARIPATDWRIGGRELDDSFGHRVRLLDGG